MSVFRKFRDFFQGPNPTEELCAALQSYGFDPQIVSSELTISSLGAKRGRLFASFASVEWESGGKSHGVVEIPKCPIRWVNVLRYEVESVWYVYVFVIPDEKLKRYTSFIHIKTVCRKNMLLIGLVKFLKWDGAIMAQRFNNLSSVNQTIIEALNSGTGSNLEIYTEKGYWLLSARKIPTFELWESYQTIARELLATPIP